jgi:hypothetical protein
MSFKLISTLAKANTSADGFIVDTNFDTKFFAKYVAPTPIAEKEREINQSINQSINQVIRCRTSSHHVSESTAIGGRFNGP